MRRAFTLIECMIVIAIMAVILAVSVPFYGQYIRGRACREAAQFLESQIQERKKRAVALGAITGICVGQESIRSFEYHPFAAGVFMMGRLISLSQNFKSPITLTVATQSAVSPQNPCLPQEAVIELSPHESASKDWQGSIALQSGSALWHVNAAPGILSDAP